MQTNTLLNELRSEGGFTYALDGSSPRPGEKLFAVAYSKDTERTFPLASFQVEDLVSFIADHAAALAIAGVHLGAWVDGDVVYLDCSLILSNLADALAFGEQNEQLAIFSFETMESIACPNAPTSKARN